MASATANPAEPGPQPESGAGMRIGIGALLVFSVLFQGGKEAWAVAVVSCVSIAGVAWLVTREARFRPPKLPAINGRWLLAAAALATLPAFAFSVEPYATRVEWMRNAAYVPFAILVLRAFGGGADRFWLLVVGAADLAAVTGFLLPDARFPGRATGTLPNPTLFCEVMIVGAGAALGLLAEEASGPRLSRRARWFLAASIGICLFEALASRSRVLLVALPAALFVAGFRVARARYGRPVPAAAVMAAAIALLAAAILWAAPSQLHARMTGLAMADPFANLRPQIWSATMEMIRAHPMGVGWGAYGAAYPWFAFPVTGTVARWGMTANFAHNEYLQILADGGWIAALGIGAFLAWVAWRGLRRLSDPRDTSRVTPAVVVFASMAVSGTVDFAWHMPFLALVLSAAAAFVLFHGEATAPVLAQAYARLGNRLDLYAAAAALTLCGFYALPPVAQYLHERARTGADPAASLAHVRHSVYASPSWKVPWVSIAEIQRGLYRESGDASALAAARAGFQEAARLAPADADIHRRHAVLLLEAAGRVTDPALLLHEARGETEAALLRDPHSAFVWQLGARIAEQEGKPNEARRLLERAVLEEPLFAAAHDDLARLLAKTDPEASTRHREAAEFAAAQSTRCTTDFERELVRRYENPGTRPRHSK